MKSGFRINKDLFITVSINGKNIELTITDANGKITEYTAVKKKKEKEKRGVSND